jgi:hypothetical protein
MSATDSLPSTKPIPSYIEEGARIAAILLVWSVIAAFFAFGLSELGGTGGLFETYSPQIGGVIAVAGLLNAILYIVYRGIDYWHELA